MKILNSLILVSSLKNQILENHQERFLSGGDAVHFPILLQEPVQYPSVDLVVQLGPQRIHIDGESTFLHSDGEDGFMYIRVPVGVEAGEHMVSVIHGNHTLVSNPIVVQPAITRVVRNKATNEFHIDGSGFSLSNTQVVIDNTECYISRVDYHHVDCHSAAKGIQEVTHERTLNGLKMKIGNEKYEILKTSVMWPLRHPRNIGNVFTNEAHAVATFFVPPASAHYTFAIHCVDGGNDCGSFAIGKHATMELVAQKNQRYPITFSARGAGLQLTASVSSDNGVVSYDHVPASWFEYDETYTRSHDIDVQSNGYGAAHRYDEWVFVEEDPHITRHKATPLTEMSISQPRLLLEMAETQTFSEWQSANGCRECVIPEDTHLVVDANINVDSLTIRGSLTWDTSKLSDDSKIETGFFMVENGGVFELDASHETSKRATLYIKNNGQSHDPWGPQSVGSHYDKENTSPAPIFRIKGRAMKRTWGLLVGDTHKQGSKKLTLDHDVADMGWKVGDRIVIANTDIPVIHQATFLGPQVLTIDGIEGNTILLENDSLNQDFMADTKLGFQAEVINLSRNVEITGDDFHDLKGLHVVGAHGGEMQVSYTRVSKCGRRGIKGRYCLHFHVLGDCPTCAFVGNAIEDSNQRGIVIHGTHRSLTDSNVLYKVRGAGLYIEDGNEMNNVLQYNVNLCHASGKDIDACKATGTPDDQADNLQQSGFWGIAMTNDLIGNRMVNHYNGLFTQVTLFPHGQGYAAKKVCTVYAPLGKIQGNVDHSNMRFGFYLDNNWPRNLKRDENGFVVDFDKCESSTPDAPCSCDQFQADGSDNGHLGHVEDGLDYANTFVGQYELGDVQYLRFRSINNIHNMYWKHTKNFADGTSSHIKDSAFEYYPLPGFPGAGVGHIMGPGGLGAFVIENTTFVGEMVEGGICANQHCTVAGTGGLCTPEYTFLKTDLTGMPKNMKWLRFGISNGDPQRPMFTSVDGSIPDAMSVASKYMSYLLDIQIDGKPVCQKASDLGLAQLYDDGILCTQPLRRLQLWTQSNLGTLHLSTTFGSTLDMGFIEPCPGTSPNCVNKQGYGAVVVVGQEYSVDLDPSDTLVWEFSDTIFADRFHMNEEITLRFRNGRTCLMKNTHDRRFIGPNGPKGVLPLGACADVQ